MMAFQIISQLMFIEEKDKWNLTDVGIKENTITCFAEKATVGF